MLSIHINNDMKINIHIDINMSIDITWSSLGPVSNIKIFALSSRLFDNILDDKVNMKKSPHGAPSAQALPAGTTE